MVLNFITFIRQLDRYLTNVYFKYSLTTIANNTFAQVRLQGGLRRRQGREVLRQVLLRLRPVRVGGRQRRQVAVGEGECNHLHRPRSAPSGRQQQPRRIVSFFLSGVLFFVKVGLTSFTANYVVLNKKSSVGFVF